MRFLCLLLISCLLLSGCGPAGREISPTFAATTEPSAPLTVQNTAPASEFLTLYAPNEDASGFIYASWEVPEISAASICGALIDAGVLNADVVFNALRLEGSQILLDVNAAFGTQLNSYGTAGEYMMMGSVVNTLLNAYSAESVSITMEGQILESGHAIYDYPMAFME